MHDFVNQLIESRPKYRHNTSMSATIHLQVYKDSITNMCETRNRRKSYTKQGKFVSHVQTHSRSLFLLRFLYSLFHNSKYSLAGQIHVATTQL